MIIKAAWDMTKEAARDLLDVSLPSGDVDWIPGFVLENWPQVRSFHNLRTRKAGPTGSSNSTWQWTIVCPWGRRTNLEMR